MQVMNLIGMATHADCMSDSAVVRSWSASMEPETFPDLDRQDKFVGEGVRPVETFQNLWDIDCFLVVVLHSADSTGRSFPKQGVIRRGSALSPGPPGCHGGCGFQMGLLSCSATFRIIRHRNA
jgi:hypothetical protein